MATGRGEEVFAGPAELDGIAAQTAQPSLLVTNSEGDVDIAAAPTVVLGCVRRHGAACFFLPMVFQSSNWIFYFTTSSDRSRPWKEWMVLLFLSNPTCAILTFYLPICNKSR